MINFSLKLINFVHVELNNFVHVTRYILLARKKAASRNNVT